MSERLAHSAMEVTLLPGGRLATPDGLVLTHDGLVASESAWDEPHLAATDILKQRRLPKTKLVSGRHASLISQWSDAYYHWMTDALPKLAVLEKAGCMDAALVLSGQPKSWQLRSLELLGVRNQLTSFSGYLQADILVWPRQVAVTGNIPAWACDWLRQRLVQQPRRVQRRLYLTRRNDTRRLTNEEVVWTLLALMGFELVDAGTLPLDEQIRLFSEAAVVVAPHGGALTNLLFAKEATIIELFDPGYVNPCFYALADRCGHQYWYAMGQPTGNGCFEIDVRGLAATLAAAGIQPTPP